MLNEPTKKPYEAEDRRKTPSSWDPNDDLVLRHLKEQLKLGWKEIASHFPNRTTNACQFRWRRLMSGTLRSNGNKESSPQHQQQPQLASNLSPPPPTTYISPALSAIISKEEQKQGQTSTIWTVEEDELLLSRQDLNPEELSVLLPMKSEAEIETRIKALTAQGRWNPPRPSSSSPSPASTYTTTNSPPPVIHKPLSSFDGLKLPTPVIQRREPSASFTLLNISL